MRVTWVIEPGAFSDEYAAFAEAIERQGHRCVRWKDDWWDGYGRHKMPELDGPVVFHGSLNIAHRVAQELDWRPGAFCATDAFHCSRWYERARTWLVHERWALSTVEQLVDAPHEVAGHLATDDQVFVRPDSPLKPFSGRVCTLTGITRRHLDFGFYYDDPTIPVVVAPLRTITREWRFVVVGREVVAGSAYDASQRSAAAGDAPRSAAEAIAGELEAPEAVYVLDLCETDDGIRLLELNPFSGADLYGCDSVDVVRAVARVLKDGLPPDHGSSRQEQRAFTPVAQEIQQE